ncbi:conserved hypothetical protein [Ricinus communis]|uniref:Uncharacterized protein n=1 Tax=Ricinus communis TaxID=3988 RepID=B9STB5_RICCO|nr:conserved hypothetical protein [Ricinus communis]
MDEREEAWALFPVRGTPVRAEAFDYMIRRDAGVGVEPNTPLSRHSEHSLSLKGI